MRYDRVYNFSAGPAMMPESVLEEIAAEVLNYHGSGMSVMEMSHRSPVFQEILSQAEADLRTLMHIPDNYKVLFVQGGGTVQFAMVPMNLMKNGVACYVETGAWSKKAIAEAKRYGEVKIVASSADKNFSYLPDCSDLDIPDNADYVYICENETINGTAYHTLPDTKGKVLVADQSSLFLSRPCDVSKYGLIWAGVQKNVGPAGMSIVIIREDLIREDLPEFVPTYLRYKTHADADSLYNTPNCWSIYCCGKVFQYLLANGGLEAMAQRNEEKATVLYDFLGRSKFFTAAVRKEDRSLMNVPFFSPSKEQDAEVAASAKAGTLDGWEVVVKPHPYLPVVERLKNLYGGAEPPSVVDGPIGNFLTPGTVVWASNSTTVALEAAFRKLPVLVQAAEDDVDLCPLQGLPGVVNVRTVSDVAAALAAPKAPDLPPDYLALDPELPRWKERLGL